jgi:geranylgeranyl diphosphate synthase type I
LAELGDLVDQWTRQELAAAITPPARRFGALLEYHLGWRDSQLEPLAVPAPSGKKLRLALVLLVSEAVAGSIEPARSAAVAVELIHNFSLVHDDIQDRSPLRRHRPTLWTLWGMEQGINAGDALFALAQLVVLRQPTALAARLAGELSRTSLLLAEGQYLDIELQRGAIPPTLEIYEAMIARKTGALFECACRLGAIAAGASAAAEAEYAAYGLQLGLAFQEQDDLLGVWGSSAETGKPEAADVLERKRGLPAALALSRPDAPDWLRAAYATDGDGSMPSELVARVVAHFDRIDIRGEIERRVAQRYRDALGALEAAEPREPARSYLMGLGNLLVARRT